MYRKLNLDLDRVDACRKAAARIVIPMLRYVRLHSTFSVERATLRFLGVVGERRGVSYASHVVESLGRERLRLGAALWLGKAMVAEQVSVQKAAETLSDCRFPFEKLERIPFEAVKEKLDEAMSSSLIRLSEVRREREKRLGKFNGTRSFRTESVAVKKYDHAPSVIAKAAREGADVVALSLLKPEKPSEQLAQQRIREMERACEAVKKEKRALRLQFEGRGLTLPEFALTSSFAGVDLLQVDPFVEALFHNLNPKRVLVDALFAISLLARAGVIMVTNDTALLHDRDPLRSRHQLLAHLLLNEQWSIAAGLPPELFAPLHPFVKNEGQEEGMLQELAHAQIVRELLVRSPIHYAPFPSAKLEPHMASLFSLVAAVTEQSVLVTDAKTFEQQRYLRSIGDELLVNPNGKISRRTHTLLENTFKFLQKIETLGLMRALEEGIFADRKVSEKEGKGVEGIFQKDRRYVNPLLDALMTTQTSEVDVSRKPSRQRKSSRRPKE